MAAQQVHSRRRPGAPPRQLEKEAAAANSQRQREPSARRGARGSSLLRAEGDGAGPGDGNGDGVGACSELLPCVTHRHRPSDTQRTTPCRRPARASQSTGPGAAVGKAPARGSAKQT
ncbi:hypothetical protein ANO11243_008820 [Dothideomycetidae sp. 11243]|nr:hypothetical protein ANO11243_008820 [fungal sp. No.11243]